MLKTSTASGSLKAGAAGYMNKESAPEELIKAIQKVLAGGRYVSPALGRKACPGLCTKTRSGPFTKLYPAANLKS